MRSRLKRQADPSPSRRDRHDANDREASARPASGVRGIFRSLQSPNYRTWAIGSLISNVGSWMQRTAQDWIVLVELTDHSATAVGIVMGLQFGPQILLLPLTGYAADHLDRRKLLFCTQATMGLLALVLGLLVVTGYVQLWHVYVFAFLLGSAAAFDSPARQTFVAELVDDDLLPNAVGLNSTSFNAASFIAVLISLVMLRTLPLRERPARVRGSLLEGFRYVLRRDDLKAVLLMLFLIGTFGLNFPIFISTMSVSVFHAGAGAYGLLTSMMAAGSVIGALMVAARPRPGIRVLLIGALFFGLGCAAAAAMPNYASFGIALMVIGIAAQTVTTSTNSYVQTSTEHSMRGRVIAILLAIVLGGTPVGAPIIGWIADALGPRWALGVGAASGVLAALVAFIYLAISQSADARAR